MLGRGDTNARQVGKLMINLMAVKLKRYYKMSRTNSEEKVIYLFYFYFHPSASLFSAPAFASRITHAHFNGCKISQVLQNELDAIRRESDDLKQFKAQTDRNAVSLRRR